MVVKGRFRRIRKMGITTVKKASLKTQKSHDLLFEGKGVTF